MSVELSKWHVYHVWCEDWTPPHHQHCICVCKLRHWFLFLNKSPPEGRKARAYTVTISNHEAHFLTRPESYVPTAPRTFQDGRVERALQDDPNNDFGRLAPSVVSRIKDMIAFNPSLREEQKAIMLSDDVIPL